MPDAYGNMTSQDIVNQWMAQYGGNSGTFSDVSVTDAADSMAKNAYYQAQAAGVGQTQALAAAQQAWSQAFQTSQLSGYFAPGVGNGTVAGQATMPNIQYTTGEFGAMYPGGFRGVSPGTPTQAALQNQQQYGLNQAGVTGVYYDPGNMTYRPGQFIRDSQTGGIGQIQSNGRMQMFGSMGDFLRAGGQESMLNDPDMVRNVSSAEYQDLASNPSANFGGRSPGTASLEMQQLYGTYGLPQQGAATMALQAMYGSNAAPYAGQKTMAQMQQDFANSQSAANMTGMWYAPQQTEADQMAQGMSIDGKSFSSLPPDQQQAYLSTRSTPQQAAADWARDNNAALKQAGYQAPAQQGQQTLAGQLQYFNEAQQLAQMYGTAFDPRNPGGTTQAGVNAPATGQQTLAAQQQYWQQAYQQSQANQTNTLAYLQQLANLRGPADWAKYQQVLGSTPQGMRDLYAASMGQYVPGGGATTGVNPQAATLQTQMEQIGGQGYGQQWGQGGYAGGYTAQPGQPQTAQTGQMQTAQWGQQPQGSGQVWGSGLGVGGDQNTPAQNQQATGNGTNTMGYNQQYNLPAPNQISAQAWGNFTPSQQQMMLGMYEANGWDKNDVQSLYNQSLPKYGTNNASAGTWRLT